MMEQQLEKHDRSALRRRRRSMHLCGKHRFVTTVKCSVPIFLDMPLTPCD